MTVQVSNLEDGSIQVRVQEGNAVRRYVVHPGRLENDVFVQTDVAQEPVEVRNLAQAVWTPAILTDYEAYLRRVALPPPPTDDELDNQMLNNLLTQQGSVVRAIAEIQFRQLKGLEPVDANLTPAQYRAKLKARMRS